MRLLLPPLFLLGTILLAQNDVTTGGYSNSRTNANTSETILNPSNVRAPSFGRLFAVDADGQLYAQPLYAHGVTINGQGTHNVVFIATMHNSVYAWDADTPGDPLWMVNLGPSASPSKLGFADITIEAGILGTPVIDRSTNTLYAVAETYENSQYYHKLHALDLSTGEEKFNGPGIISGSVAGTGAGSLNGSIQFSSHDHLQRPALLLLNGVVYVAFGSHADQGNYHGWLFGYSASNVQQQTAIFNTTPSSKQAAIWQGGRGPAADSSGFIYLSTGNGEWDGTTSFGQSFLKLDSSRKLAIADWFTTAAWQETSATDTDFGSSGVALLPGTSFMIGGDKGGNVYIADENDLGKLTSNDIGIYDKQAVVGYGIFTFAVANNVFYTQSVTQPIKAFAINGGHISATPSSASATSHVVGYDGFSVSSNGTTPDSGILWATTTEVSGSSSASTLHAFNAANLGDELWNSDMVPNRDTLGWFARFATPTVANGKVYVPTFSNRLVVYGLLPSSGISGVASAASFENTPVSPHEIVTLFGAAMGPATTATTQLDSNGKVKTELSGAQVLFDGVAAPLIFINSDQAAVVVPESVAGKTSTSVQVEYNGVRSDSISVAVSDAAPALFTLAESGFGPAVALNQDLSVNSATNPDARGSVIVLYGTGEGATTPVEADAALTVLKPPFPTPDLPVTVTIGGQPATVIYAGPTAGFDGLLQINAVVPEGIATGAVPVQVTVGTRNTASGVTISVK